jgi:hypothetical protein
MCERPEAVVDDLPTMPSGDALLVMENNLAGRARRKVGEPMGPAS